MSKSSRHPLLPIGVTLAALVVAACGAKSSSALHSAASTVTSPASPSTTAPAPVVAVGTNAKLGQILVDANGLTLYYDANEKGGAIACTGRCASVWPPLLLPAGVTTPTAAKGVPGTLATVTRPDGGTQVTYNGKPLYRFTNDGHPGDAAGQGVASFFVIQIGAASTTTTAAAAAPEAVPTTAQPASPATTTPKTSPTTAPRTTSPPTSPPTTRPPTTTPTTTCAYPPCY